eukprot:TRINITY_DN38470_c0_g1_i1.p1 TRINITY_DN38470_c0_g1~~TRINITY_DN38470_c0_g1_i1.p1  ORF type:complete len:291 (+),score=40.34 TRINITY_DN38470_c0_g1_i1:47-874(+)
MAADGLRERSRSPTSQGQSVLVDTGCVISRPGGSDGQSWTKNLLFSAPSGFWGDQAWYDLHLQRRLPESEQMLRELVLSLPPCSGKRVLDYGAGAGRSALAVAAAYPSARLTLLDSDAVRGDVALRRLSAQAVASAEAGDSRMNVEASARFVECRLLPDGALLPEATVGGKEGYDVCIAVQAVRHVCAPPAHYAGQIAQTGGADTIADKYRRVFDSFHCSLVPGGHVFVSDHVAHGHPGVYEHMNLLSAAGFIDVDVSWRHRDWFVIGARKRPAT